MIFLSSFFEGDMVSHLNFMSRRSRKVLKILATRITCQRQSDPSVAGCLLVGFMYLIWDFSFKLFSCTEAAYYLVMVIVFNICQPPCQGVLGQNLLRCPSHHSVPLLCRIQAWQTPKKKGFTSQKTPKTSKQNPKDCRYRSAPRVAAIKVQSTPTIRISKMNQRFLRSSTRTCESTDCSRMFHKIFKCANLQNVTLTKIFWHCRKLAHMPCHHIVASGQQDNKNDIENHRSKKLIDRLQDFPLSNKLDICIISMLKSPNQKSTV